MVSELCITVSLWYGVAGAYKRLWLLKVKENICGAGKESHVQAETSLILQVPIFVSPF